jgi:hypothetical protein
MQLCISSIAKGFSLQTVKTPKHFPPDQDVHNSGTFEFHLSSHASTGAFKNKKQAPKVTLLKKQTTLHVR